MIGNKASLENVREIVVVYAVMLISAITLGAVLVVLVSSSTGAQIAYDTLNAQYGPGGARRFSTYLATGLGVTIATTGLSATVICLLLRLRNHDNDMVTPPALTGPIVVVALGAALALGALIFA